MESLTKGDVVSALEEKPISSVVEQLKSGIRRDPYWAEGHRLLGDLYLTELNHDSYALVEYRKLDDIQDDPNPEDLLRLSIAYARRSFDEKSLRTLGRIDREALPEKLNLINEELDVSECWNRLSNDAEKAEDEQAEDWFERHRRDGEDYLKAGNLFRAQEEFERALDYRDDNEVKVSLAHCLLRRRQYPRAVTLLKDVLSRSPDHEKAKSLLKTAYDRLGIRVDKDADIDHVPESQRRAG